MMRKNGARLLLGVLMLVLLSGLPLMAVAQEAVTYTVTVEYQLDGYESRSISVDPNASIGKIESLAFSGGYSKMPNGYTFDAWFYNADCTDPVPRTLKVSSDVTLYASWTPWDEETAALYAAYNEELALARKLTLQGAVYETEGLAAYYSFIRSDVLDRIEIGNNASVTQALVDAMVSHREALVPTGKTEEEVLWYIWEGNVAGAEEDNSQDAYDGEGFVPFICAYLVEDQSQVKGNIITAAGSGAKRSNDIEGYTVAKAFNDMGYNAYVLNYRSGSAAIDMQRAIRYIRYYADEKGIGAVDRMGAIGFSFGSATVSSVVQNYYGDVLPTVRYADYTPDAIDAVNSDLNAMIMIYGGGAFDTENPNIPPCFIASGAADGLNADIHSLEVYQWMRANNVPVEMHMYAGVPHAVGLGDGYEAANQMGAQIDTFLQVVWGDIPRVIAE